MGVVLFTKLGLASVYATIQDMLSTLKHRYTNNWNHFHLQIENHCYLGSSNTQAAPPDSMELSSWVTCMSKLSVNEKYPTFQQNTLGHRERLHKGLFRQNCVILMRCLSLTTSLLLQLWFPAPHVLWPWTSTHLHWAPECLDGTEARDAQYT